MYNEICLHALLLLYKGVQPEVTLLYYYEYGNLEKNFQKFSCCKFSFQFILRYLYLFTTIIIFRCQHYIPKNILLLKISQITVSAILIRCNHLAACVYWNLHVIHVIYLSTVLYDIYMLYMWVVQETVYLFLCRE